MSLPVMSVDSIEEAEQLQVFACKQTYPDEKGQSRYVVPRASGFEVSNVKSLDAAGDWLEEQYQQLKRRSNG